MEEKNKAQKGQEQEKPRGHQQPAADGGACHPECDFLAAIEVSRAGGSYQTQATGCCQTNDADAKKLARHAYETDRRALMRL